MDFYKKYNLTILAIPAYYVMGVIPHMYAISVATQGAPLEWDNRAPRSAEHKAEIKSALSDEDYALYERAEGASANAIENLPLFASAVIVGNAAGIQRGGWFGLDAFVGAFLGLRALHTISYITGSTKNTAWLKTGLWTASLATLVTIFGKSARILNRSAI